MKYPKNNLNEVIFHIKFSPSSKLLTDEKEAIFEFHKYVEKEFPELNLEKNKPLPYNVEGSGKIPENKPLDNNPTWILSADNKKILINKNELILNHDGEIYDSFDEFLKDVNMALKGLKNSDLRVAGSIGLRYINQIEIDDENHIDEYFNPELHLKTNGFKKEEFVESLTKTDLIIDDYYLILKYGRFNPDYPNRTSKKDVILDYDCIYDFDEELDYIPITLNRMHEIIKNRFESDITDRLREKMKNPKKRSLINLDIDRTPYRMGGPRIVKRIKIDW